MEQSKQNITIDFILQRRAEFLKLSADSGYYNICFDKQTGALQATHKDHNFDPEKGHYEKEVVKVLYENGNKIILESEKKPEGIKTPDGSLNNRVFEIKTVEGTGKNNIKNKLNEAASQGCARVVLYFPDNSLYSLNRILEGYKKYKGIINKEGLQENLQHIWIVVDNKIIVFK